MSTPPVELILWRLGCGGDASAVAVPRIRRRFDMEHPRGGSILKNGALMKNATVGEVLPHARHIAEVRSDREPADALHGDAMA